MVGFRWDGWKGFRFSLNVFQSLASGSAKGPWWQPQWGEDQEENYAGGRRHQLQQREFEFEFEFIGPMKNVQQGSKVPEPPRGHRYETFRTPTLAEVLLLQVEKRPPRRLTVTWPCLLAQGSSNRAAKISLRWPGSWSTRWARLDRPPGRTWGPSWCPRNFSSCNKLQSQPTSSPR